MEAELAKQNLNFAMLMLVLFLSVGTFVFALGPSCVDRMHRAAWASVMRPQHGTAAPGARGRHRSVWTAPPKPFASDPHRRNHAQL